MSELTITEVSKKYNIKPDTISYYERIGLLNKIPRKNNGNRYFNEGMQGWIEMIVCLRHSGVPVEKLIDYADMLRVGDETLQAREDLLKEQLKELEQKKKDLNRSINRLKHKISLYESGEIRENKSYFEEYKILDD